MEKTPEELAAEAAAQAEAEAAAAAATGGEDEDHAGAAELGEAGKRALDAMKGKWRTERDRAKVAEDKLAAATKSKAPAEDDKPDLDAIRQQARDEAAVESLRERALDKLEAKAARLFTDPEDARAFLASKVDDFIDGKTVDVDAISDALTELLEKRPYLGVAQGDTKRFKGTGDGGARNGSQPQQFTAAQVKTMTPEQIVEAQRKGLLADYLAS